MGETRAIETYIAKEDVYDCAGYGKPKIPKGAHVEFIGEYTCFYGRYIKVSYDGNTYYTRPKQFKKVVTIRRLLNFAISGCYAKHPHYNRVTLIAKIVTESNDSGKEFWIAADADGHHHIIDVGDCMSFFLVDKQYEEAVTYFG